jgi:segregation and condensation protein A
MIDRSIAVKTNNFDGPLALLLFLIERQEMKIADLDLGSITLQYLDYLERMKILNFDVAGDYLYFLATLLLLKSQSALNEDVKIDPPPEGDENLKITSREELIARLEELKKFQRLGTLLWGLPKMGHEVFTKPKVNKKEIIDSILTPLDLDELIRPMLDLMRRNARQFEIIQGDNLSLVQKVNSLKGFLNKGQRYQLGDLLSSSENLEILVTFLCLLELARLKKVALYQNEPFSPIYLEMLEDLQDIEGAFFEEPEKLLLQ